MIDLLLAGGSFLTSAAGGSLVKILAGGTASLFSNWRQSKQEAHERRLADKGQDVISYREVVLAGADDPNVTRSVLWTRRLLALSIVWTFCYIALLWAKNPDVIITTFLPGDPGAVSFFWGLVSFPVSKDVTVEVSTGAIAWGLMNFVSFVMALYFTPGGSTKR